MELLLSELEDCIPSREEDFNQQDTIDLINQFLQETSITKRKIFVRRYWYGSTIKEIAADFSYSESNVSTTLFRLRAQLKERLEEEGIFQ